jgi:hypothetical protein
VTEIIQFPGLDIGCPTSVAELGAAGCVLLIAMRWWVEGYRHGENALPRLYQGLEIAGAPAAVGPIQSMMDSIAQTVQRPLQIHAPSCPCLSSDERQLLDAAQLAQQGHEALAERALRTALLSAQGAEIAITKLSDIGALFAAARLYFNRRRGARNGEMPMTHESWVPPRQPETIH